MTYVYCDRMSRMISVTVDGSLEFLGPLTQSMLAIQEMGYTTSQARAAVLQAYANMGMAVEMEQITRTN